MLKAKATLSSIPTTGIFREMSIKERIEALLSSSVHLGITAIIAFLTLIVGVVGTLIAYYPRPAPPPPAEKKSLALQETKVVDVDALAQQAELPNYVPSHKYIIDYNLVNSGDKAVVPADWIQGLTICAIGQGQIANVASRAKEDDRTTGVFSIWVENESKRWVLQPVLLNSQAQMPFTVTFIAGFKGSAPILYRPESEIRWLHQIVDIDSISLQDLTYNQVDPFFALYQQLINDESPIIRFNIFGGHILFRGDKVYQFMCLSLILFCLSVLLLSRKYPGAPFSWLVLSQIIVLLICSIDVAEVVLYVATYGLKTLAWPCYPAFAFYIAYLYYLWRPNKIVSGSPEDNKIDGVITREADGSTTGEERP